MVERQIHTTVGVYPNWKVLGDMGYKINGVASEDLSDHIKYNLTFRPGRALFVDGVCKHRGTLPEEDILFWEERIKTDPKFKATAVSAPYW